MKFESVFVIFSVVVILATGYVGAVKTPTSSIKNKIISERQDFRSNTAKDNDTLIRNFSKKPLLVQGNFTKAIGLVRKNRNAGTNYYGGRNCKVLCAPKSDWPTMMWTSRGAVPYIKPIITVYDRVSPFGQYWIVSSKEAPTKVYNVELNGFDAYGQFYKIEVVGEVPFCVKTRGVHIEQLIVHHYICHSERSSSV